MYVILVFLLSLFCLLSKEFLVFNEELLIFFSFLLFVYLNTTLLGSVLLLELNKDVFYIQDKLLAYKNMRRNTCLILFDYYQQQCLLFSHLEEFQVLTKKMITIFLFPSLSVRISTLLLKMLEKKWKKIGSIKVKASKLCYEYLNIFLIFFVFFMLKKLNKQEKKKLFKRSLSLLKVIHKKEQF